MTKRVQRDEPSTPASSSTSSNDDVVRLRPYSYVHIHDGNTNTTRLLVGPSTYTRLEHEHFTSQVEPFINVPPQHYCIVDNPAAKSAEGAVIVDKASGAVKNRLGHKELRLTGPSFPLYPGEALSQPIAPLTVLTALEALRVTAIADFKDGKVERRAGDEWIVNGPCCVTPSVHVQVVEKLTAISVSDQSNLILRAERNFTDRTGVKRTAGEEWLYSKPGSFIRAIEETVIGKQDAIVLTEQTAIHVSALKDFTDRFDKKRRTGEQWLVTVRQCPTFIPTPNERVINASVQLTVLGKGQYAVVLNPVGADGQPKYGCKELRTGICTFFLHPTESLEGGIKTEHVLGKDEGLILYAKAAFEDVLPDGKKVRRAAGDRWMIRGPAAYTLPVEVRLVDRRKAIPLDENEGVYIRNLRTGRVRAHIGKTVLLNEDEELWNKELPALVEDLLTRPRYTKHLKMADDLGGRAPRNKSKVVTCNVPHNHFVQVYDFTSKKARVVRGPELVWLAPDEDLTVMSLSGGTPKQGDLIKTLCLFAGPDFATDMFVVETRDHARLKLHLSYNWLFDLDLPDIQRRMFNVPDFVGDMCKALAAKIRSAVASEPFDQFHLHANKIIKDAVFGEEKPEKAKKSSSEGGAATASSSTSRGAKDESTSEEDDEDTTMASMGQRRHQRLAFDSNGLIITNVDIHSVDPVDQKTSEALTKSVQLAIEITTSSQEADARHHALSLEQAAKGKLERSIIEDKRLAEGRVAELIKLECENAVVEAMGSSKAESQARAESAKIECETEVEIAKKRVQAATIVSSAELDIFKKRRELELVHKSNMLKLEIHRARTLAEIETDKFKKIIKAIGKETIKSISRAGPEMQARLLKSLGIESYLISDGSNPINLFNAAKGLTGGH